MKLLNYLLIFVTALIALACSKEEFKSETNLPFLDTKSKTSELEKLDENDAPIIFQALERMSFAKQANGTMVLTTKNGNEANVSENVYKCIWNLIHNGNRYILSKENSLKTRTFLPYIPEDTTNNNQKIPYATDCGIVSVVHSTEYDYEYVRNIVESVYGKQGVPKNKFYEMIQIFGEWNQIPYTQIYDFKPGEDKGIAIVPTGNKGVEHAVNIVYWNAHYNFLILYDYQTPSNNYDFSSGGLNRSEINEIYILTRRNTPDMIAQKVSELKNPQ